MIYRVITLFPELFTPFFTRALFGAATENGLIDADTVNLREFGRGKHRSVDDTPYGGGPGMLMRPEPLVQAIESIEGHRYLHKILLSPSGKLFDSRRAEELAQKKGLILICGRYEGIDARVKAFTDEEISIGNFVLMGGEIAAMSLMESISRFIPGVLGNRESPEVESHSGEYAAEFDQYTKPAQFRGLEVPAVLRSGHHKEIELWRRQNAEQKAARLQMHTHETDGNR